jgi:type I restriction enzyme, S subunit
VIDGLAYSQPSNWQTIKLGDAATFINGYAFKPSDWKTEGLEIIRIQNLTKSSNSLNYYDGEINSRYKVKKGDFLISWSATLGIFEWVGDDAWLNQHLFKVVFDKKQFDKSFFKHLIAMSLEEIGKETHGSTMKHITKPRFDNFKIPYPPLAEQQKIAAILDAADSLRQKDQQLVERYTALSQSLFLEMFGDPVTNPMGWKAVLLEEISDIASGVTKGRKLTSDEVIDIPYMRVANVQDGYLDLNEIKYIPGSKVDLEKYILKNGDLLLTEGGDPDKLGRGAVWNGEIKNCIHQNHIFRVRLTSQSHIPLYLSKLCGSEYGKRYFIKSGKQTTGIASINKTQLRRFPVLCPPIVLQNQFAERIQLIEAQKQQAQRSLEKSEALFNSLLQRAFTGELTA